MASGAACPACPPGSQSAPSPRLRGRKRQGHTAAMRCSDPATFTADWGAQTTGWHACVALSPMRLHTAHCVKAQLLPAGLKQDAPAARTADVGARAPVLSTSHTASAVDLHSTIPQSRPPATARTADVGARAPVHVEVKVVSAAARVLAQVALGVRLVCVWGVRSVEKRGWVGDVRGGAQLACFPSGNVGEHQATSRIKRLVRYRRPRERPCHAKP